MKDLSLDKRDIVNIINIIKNMIKRCYLDFSFDREKKLNAKEVNHG